MEIGSDKRIKAILNLLPGRIARAFERMDMSSMPEEIRLRAGRPPQIVAAKGEELLSEAVFSAAEAKELLEKLCCHSVYAMEEELKKGFVTLEGGIRVGVSGRPVVREGRVIRLTSVSCFNIRITREALGCAEGVMGMLLEEGRPVSCLIAAPPGGGKTTLLRDIARCLSDGIGSHAFKVALADERGELAGCVNGVPSFCIGARTDVMEFAPKAEAIPMLVRTMSPDVIITDEIGDPRDAEAVSEASRCGAAVIASAHASSYSELKERRALSSLLGSGAFRRILLLKRSGSVLHVSRAGL